MKSLKNVPGKDKHHYGKCPVCKHYFNMRDLNDVLIDEHYMQRVPTLNYSHSVKVGEPMMYYKNDREIILN